MNKVVSFFLTFLFLSTFCSAQSISIRQTLLWQENPIVHNPTGNHPLEIWTFDGAVHGSHTPTLPYFGDAFPVNSHGQLSVELVSVQYESFGKPASSDDWVIQDDIVFKTRVEQERRNFVGKVSFLPIRKTGPNQFERITSFELRVTFTPLPQATNRDTYTFNSVLSDGDIYKIAVSEEGIHKITHDFLKNDLGIDIDNTNPSQIRLYGNGGGPLPEPVIAEQVDDLEENAIWISGGNDGVFNADDFILFYAQGPHRWQYSENENILNRVTNTYDIQSYYFLKIESGTGKQVGDANHSVASIGSTAFTTNAYTDLIRLEDERYNLLFESPNSQGSGQMWWGDAFNPLRTRNYDFDLPGLLTNEPSNIKVSMVARGANSSTYKVMVSGQTYISGQMGNVNTSNPEGTYAKAAVMTHNFQPTQSTLSVAIEYPSVGDGTNTAWLDYIQLNARRSLQLVGGQVIFRDLRSLDHPSTKYEIGGANASTQIWDITNPLAAKAITGANLSGNTLRFGAASDELKTFVAFNPSNSFPSPVVIGEKLENQNYHGINNVDMVIVYYSEFLSAAQLLAQHRADYSDLTIELVDIDKLFNEFSSGAKDPTAIRDFAHMLFTRSDQFKHLLLLGDGSFDARNIYGTGKDFIPVYETRNSLNPISSFPTDDYFSLLTDDDGGNINSGLMDIAVGRFPVRSLEEANAVVNKIIHYDTSKDVLGDWRNRVSYIADDEDSNRHITDSDIVSNRVEGEHPIVNVGKIYFDAFQQVPTSGGARYPEVQEAINRDMFKGLLVMSYMGHGGGKGWAQERVLTNADIASWNNFDHMPLLVTATCSFAGYDEATFTSAGEQVFLNPNGGAIALFTTTRAVFTNSNRELNIAVFDTLLDITNSYRPSMGEILRVAKNQCQNCSTENSRKFIMLGDPSQHLAIPELNVLTTSVNGNPVGSGLTDTIRALQTVTIEGVVADNNGSVLTDFNGIVYPTIYDKKVTVTTLGQDAGSRPTFDFQLQRNIIFKGRATVTNGVFSFTFVVPKDINYAYDKGKISYYAENGTQVDARGYYDGIVIGGTDPNGIQDDKGPLVEVFMNTEEFVSGGLTDPNPTLLVKLSDDHGINVVGNSIGHDLTGILDQNTQNTYILNDFYEAEIDDHTKGTVRYPLFNIAEGHHQIKVTAWDVANNSADGFTDFVVANGEEAALDHVLNYPNPFTTCTNFQFEHNMAGQTLDVQVQIFTVSGKLAKTIHTQIDANGYRVTDIKWDGRDDYGDQLAKGVYVYKVKVNSLSDPSGQTRGESDFEKLVILK